MNQQAFSLSNSKRKERKGIGREKKEEKETRFNRINRAKLEGTVIGNDLQVTHLPGLSKIINESKNIRPIVLRRNEAPSRCNLQSNARRSIIDN